MVGGGVLWRGNDGLRAILECRESDHQTLALSRKSGAAMRGWIVSEIGPIVCAINPLIEQIMSARPAIRFLAVLLLALVVSAPAADARVFVSLGFPFFPFYGPAYYPPAHSYPPPYYHPPQGAYGYAPQGSYGYAPQGSYGYAPQGSYGYAPQGSYGYAPQGSYGDSPEGSYAPDAYAQNAPQR